MAACLKKRNGFGLLFIELNPAKKHTGMLRMFLIGGSAGFGSQKQTPPIQHGIDGAFSVFE